MLVQQRRDAVGVADDAGDVGGRAERADLQRPVGELREPLAQVVQAHPAVGVLADGHDVGDRLAPRHLVGVVLVGADEDHRPLVARDLLAQVPAVLEGGRDAQPEHADQLVDRPGAPRPGEDHHGVVVAVHGVADDAAGVLAQPGGLQAGAAALGVRVGVAGQHLVADEVLEEGEGPTGCRVVGIRDPAPPVGRGHHVVLTDDGLANAAHQRLLARLRCRALSHADSVSRPVPTGEAGRSTVCRHHESGCRTCSSLHRAELHCRARRRTVGRVNLRPGSTSDGCSLRTRKRAETRSALVQAAYAIVRDDGFEGLTAEAVADRAGVSRRTFFNYFPSVESVLTASVTEFFASVGDRLEARPVDEDVLDSALAVVTDPGDGDLLERIGVLAAAGRGLAARPRADPRRAARLARLARGLAAPPPGAGRTSGHRPLRRHPRLQPRRGGRGGVPGLAARRRRHRAHRRHGIRRPRFPPRLLHRRDRPRPHRPGPPARHPRRANPLTPLTHEKAPMSSLLYRLGRWCAAHAWRTLTIWLVLLVGLGVLAGTVGKPLTSQISIPGTTFQKVIDGLGKEIPEAAGGAGTVVLQSADGTADHRRAARRRRAGVRHLGAGAARQAGQQPVRGAGPARQERHRPDRGRHRARGRAEAAGCRQGPARAGPGPARRRRGAHRPARGRQPGRPDPARAAGPGARPAAPSWRRPRPRSSRPRPTSPRGAPSTRTARPSPPAPPAPAW